MALCPRIDPHALCSEVGPPRSMPWGLPPCSYALGLSPHTLCLGCPDTLCIGVGPLALCPKVGSPLSMPLGWFPTLYKHTLDQGMLTWRDDSVLNYIACCLKSSLVDKSTVELYCDLDGLHAPGGGSISADVIVQAQRPDLVIIDRSVHGRHRIALVELTCPWDTDAERA
jgi:hypothetical protein